MKALTTIAADNLLSPAEVASRLGVKAETLAQWRWRKTGPAFVKVGRLVRYEPEAIDAWLSQGGVTSSCTPR